jgi:type I restriction enzyme M protein
MSDGVQEKLREVWDICRQAGIANDRELVEYISALLLEVTGVEPLSKELQPRRPHIRYRIEEAELEQLLQEAIHSAKGAGLLLDRYVLFQSSRTPQKGSYPIPRHIINFMLDMLHMEPTDSFADFACGSGGFLVHRNKNERPGAQPGPIVGVDINPEIARIAAANVVLNYLPRKQTRIYSEDAFRICSPDGPLGKTEFDCIAMAPSFGKPANERLAREVLGIESGGFNETLFTYLAVKKLRRSGKAVVMVPTSLLSRTQDSQLRRMLSEEQTIKAVISLNEGMLYPFNDLATALLYVEKQRSNRRSQTWFFKVEQDGYLLTRSRDLTAPPSSSSDMPLVMEAFTYDSADFTPIPREDDGSLALRVGWLSTPEASSKTRQRRFLGMLIKIPEQVLLASVRLISTLQRENQERYLIAEVGVAQQKTTFIALPLTDKEHSRPRIQQFSSRSKCFSSLYEMSERDAETLPDVFLFRNGVDGQLLAFTPDGRLLGVSAYRTAIADEQYNLQPEHYIPEQQTTRREIPTAVTLSEIKKRQAIIKDYADNLLGRVEMKPLIGEQLPPRVAPGLLSDGYTTLIPLFDTRQERIWKHIRSQQSHQEQAMYFTSDDLQKQLETAQPDAGKVDIVSIQQMLDLLVRLGLIVHVIVRDPGTDTVKRYYRLATEQDQPAPIEESEPR